MVCQIKVQIANLEFDKNLSDVSSLFLHGLMYTHKTLQTCFFPK